MKYALIDNEIHSKPGDDDTWWPISNEEAAHIVDVMNALAAKSGEDKLAAIATLVLDVQNSSPLKGPDHMTSENIFAAAKKVGALIAPVGSRVTCNPHPKNTDIDYLVLIRRDDSFYDWLSETSWLQEGDDTYDMSDFTSWRNGEFNLIITHAEPFYWRFMLATDLAKRFNLLDRGDRIALFQGILYNQSVEV